MEDGPGPPPLLLELEELELALIRAQLGLQLFVKNEGSLLVIEDEDDKEELNNVMKGLIEGTLPEMKKQLRLILEWIRRRMKIKQEVKEESEWEDDYLMDYPSSSFDSSSGLLGQGQDEVEEGGETIEPEGDQGHQGPPTSLSASDAAVSSSSYVDAGGGESSNDSNNTHHQEPSLSFEEEDSDPVIPSHPCKICGKTFASGAGLSNHKKRVHAEETCPAAGLGLDICRN